MQPRFAVFVTGDQDERLRVERDVPDPWFQCQGCREAWKDLGSYADHVKANKVTSDNRLFAVKVDGARRIGVIASQTYCMAAVNVLAFNTDGTYTTEQVLYVKGTELLGEPTVEDWNAEIDRALSRKKDWEKTPGGQATTAFMQATMRRAVGKHKPRNRKKTTRKK